MNAIVLTIIIIELILYYAKNVILVVKNALIARLGDVFLVIIFIFLIQVSANVFQDINWIQVCASLVINLAKHAQMEISMIALRVASIKFLRVIILETIANV